MQPLLVLAFATVATANIQCHCQPADACWPSLALWSQLNASVEGRLAEVKPIGAVCHEPNYNKAACQAVQFQSNSSAYLSSQPGALQWENWSAWPSREEECFFKTPRNKYCGQGRVSLYAVLVKSISDIQAAIRFAAQHKIKLTIRNTGHSFQGQSSAPNSLQINVHNLSDIHITDSFVPQVPMGVSTPAGIPAATLGGGVQMHSAYKALNAKGVTIPGGSSSTVGATGGFLQGGGHGILGYLAGMASDNALEFTIVVANGSTVIANDYQNQDLFWALRGGGGGSWGVVISATIRTYPDYPVTVATISYNMTSPTEQFWSGVNACNRHVVDINNHGATGYYYIVPYESVSLTDLNVTYASFNMYLYFVNQTNTQTVQNILKPMIGDMRNATAGPVSVATKTIPTVTELLLYIFPGTDYDGEFLLIGSRLLSRSFFNSTKDAATKLTESFKKLALESDEYIQGAIVAGGQVAKNRDYVDSALNPAWRDTAVHLNFIRLWTSKTPLKSYAAIAKHLTTTDMPLLERLDSRPMAAYCNEADANQPEFQKVFWGDNYDRLFEIKQAVDPDNLFVSRMSVGSELWDEDGACPKSKHQ